jgi:DNA-directed RNA polymerase subunit beta
MALNAGIGKLGRRKYNDRLGSNVPLHIHYLVPQDLFAAVDLALDLVSGAATLQVDDIDSLENRRLRSCGEAMENIVQGWFAAVEDDTSGGIPVSVDISKLTGTPDGKTMEDFCMGEISKENNNQLCDDVNGLSEVVHARKVTQVGDLGLDAIKRIESIRLVHHTHYGRICPVDTGEGMNAGIVGSLASYARVSADGEIIVPHQSVSNGRRRFQEPWIWTRAVDQMHLRVAQFDSAHTADGVLSKPVQGVEAEPEVLDTATVVHVGRFTRAPTDGVELIACGSPMSVGTSMIPFLEHDDANRLQMGAKMQGQAVPCMWPERPLVGTGMEAYVAASSSWNKRAELPGQVLYADGQEVTVVSSTVSRSKQPSAPGVGDVESLELPGGWEKSDVHLRSEMSSSWPIDVNGSKKHTLHHQSTVAIPGGTVSTGDIVAEGSCMSGGEAAIGKNIVAAYLPYEGYNYEDAIVISQRLVREHVLTSTHIVEVERELAVDERLSCNASSWENGLPPEGTWVEGSDVLAVVERFVLADPTSGVEGVSSEVPLAGPDGLSVKEIPLRVPDDVRGRVISSTVQRRRISAGTCEFVTVLIAMDSRVQVGDKLSGRHGNKGIVAKILDDRDMPYLPDGTPLDIILNPLGVPSRMNVGQIFECLLGSAARWTDQEYRIGSFDEMFADDASRALVFDALGRARDRTGYRWLLDPRAPGKTRLYDGRTGVALEQPVTAGISYILKLVHMVRDKIHVRSSGRYSAATLQPIKGRAAGGGQRLGEMEVSAMVAYGAHSALQELVTIKSDDVVGRDKARNAIAKGEPVVLPQGATAEGYRTFERELAASGFLLQGRSLERCEDPDLGA